MRPRPMPLFVAALLAAAGSALSAEPPRGLVLHYSFDRAEADGTIQDSSDHKHAGRIAGARWVPNGKKEGGCLLSAESRIEVAAGQADELNAATLALWFQAGRADVPMRTLLGVRGSQDLVLSIGGGPRAPDARGKVAILAGESTPCLSDKPVADGLWHHVAVTFDGEHIRMYVDGEPQRQVVAGRLAPTRLFGALVVGKRPDEEAPKEQVRGFDGTIDDLMVFNRALSADEIKALVFAVDPHPGKPQFTRDQAASRVRMLRMLYDEGLITEEFYTRKVAECEAGLVK